MFPLLPARLKLRQKVLLLSTHPNLFTQQATGTSRRMNAAYQPYHSLISQQSMTHLYPITRLNHTHLAPVKPSPAAFPSTRRPSGRSGTQGHPARCPTHGPGKTHLPLGFAGSWLRVHFVFGVWRRLSEIPPAPLRRHPPLQAAPAGQGGPSTPRRPPSPSHAPGTPGPPAAPSEHSASLTPSTDPPGPPSPPSHLGSAGRPGERAGLRAPGPRRSGPAGRPCPAPRTCGGRALVPGQG